MAGRPTEKIVDELVKREDRESENIYRLSRRLAER